MFLNIDTATTNLLGGRNITELFPTVTLFQVYKSPIGYFKSNHKMLKICRTKGYFIQERVCIATLGVGPKGIINPIGMGPE